MREKKFFNRVKRNALQSYSFGKRNNCYDCIYWKIDGYIQVVYNLAIANMIDEYQELIKFLTWLRNRLERNKK